MNQINTPPEHSEQETKARQRAMLIGHDIRNAVGDIIGGLELTETTNLPKASQQQLARARSASEQLARLTDEMLALILGETIAGAQDPRQLNLDDMLGRLRARWQGHAQEKKLKFRVERSADLPDEIGCEHTAIERILTNLIGNAMKYTDQGCVTLGVCMRAQETLCWTVRDTGPGFSSGALERLFEFNAQPPDNAKPGSGLGLSIVRDLAESIGAHIEVRNLTEGGASVSVLLPRIAWAPGVALPSAAQGLPDLSGYRVLLAEDSPTVSLMTQQMLETLGATCLSANDGIEALEILRDYRVDLALIDIEMPRLSGLDLIKAMREPGSGHETLPTLAITAYVLSANRAEIYEAGANGILAKPVLSIEAFGAAIRNVLRRRAIDTTPVSRPAPAAAPGRLHLDRLLALAGEDQGPELLQRLIADFTHVRDGLSESHIRNDFPTVRARTHILISLAGAIGATTLQDLAEQMNALAHRKDSGELHHIGPKVEQGLAEVLIFLTQEQSNRFGGPHA